MCVPLAMPQIRTCLHYIIHLERTGGIFQSTAKMDKSHDEYFWEASSQLDDIFIEMSRQAKVCRQEKHIWTKALLCSFQFIGRNWLSAKIAYLTHWGQEMHICINKLTIVGSDNGLGLTRRQAIILTNARISLIRCLGTNFNETRTFSFKKMPLKMLPVKCRPVCRQGSERPGSERMFLSCIWIWQDLLPTG